MSQVDSRHNGCVVSGALGDKLSRSSVSCANSILAAFEMSLCCAIPILQPLHRFQKDRLNPAGDPRRPKKGSEGR